MPIPFSDEEGTATVALPWSVRATHTNFDPAITSSTNVTLRDGTVGNYQASLLFADHRISLPLPGTITHFVSPEQPIFTFTQPTRVFMFIPMTTNVAPIKLEGWAYVPIGLSGNASPMLNFPVPAFDEMFSGVISSVDYDYCYEKFYVAGTFNLDPNNLAPEAFYLFEELIDGNVLSELRQRQMYVFENVVFENTSGNYGFGTTNPSARVHVDGSVLVTNGNIRASGSIEAGTNFTTGTADDSASYFGRARVGGGGYPSLDAATFIHRNLEANHTKDFAMSHQNQGTLILNTKSGSNLHFKTNGGQTPQVNNDTPSGVSDRMTIYEAGADNTKGFVGINVYPPTERLHVGGNIKATNITATSSIESSDIKAASLEVGKDTDTTCYLGRAAVGKVGTPSNPSYWSDQASFAHIDMNTEYNFALKQDRLGYVSINSPQRIDFTKSLVSKMRLTSAGDLGIGTPTSGSTNNEGVDEKLHVVGNIKATGTLEAHANSNDATAVSQIGFAKIGTNTWNNTVSFSHKDKHNTSSFGMRFGPEGHTVLNSAGGKYTQLTIGNSQAIHIGPNKNVRIGTTVSEPSHKLHVDGDIKATGNLGIGTNPTAKLDVAGDAKVSGSVVIGPTSSRRIGVGVVTPPGEKLRVNGAVTVYGNIAATGSVSGSDDRMKHNEEDISDSLSVIRKLKPQKYQKTKELKAADFNGPLEEDDILCVEAGFIAQDVLALPELAYSVIGGDYTETTEDSEGNVTTNTVASPHYLNYNNILTYNVAATKELDATVTALLAEVASLKERLSVLER